MSLTLSTNNNIGSVQLSTVSNTVDIAETWTINETAIMYTRAKTIEFKAEGLKPNTRYYPFFDGVDISNFCSTVNNQTSSEIYSNSIGNILGYFYLPTATFTCGSHTFKLVDSVISVTSTNGSSVYLPDPQYGSAEAKYEAIGILKQQQKQITTLTVIDAPQTPAVTTPNPIPTPLPQPPVVVYPPPQIPEPILPAIAINPPITSPALDAQNKLVIGGGCNKWYFHYTITNILTQPDYTVSSMSSTPPSIVSIQNLWPNTAEKPSVTYVQSIKISDNQWNHIFSISVNFVRLYKRTILSNTELSGVIWRTAASLKPSGLASTDIYAPYIPAGSTTPWENAGQDLSVCKFSLQSDPLAQSFYVDQNQYASGIFVTSISVYFKKVDQSCPVLLELRNMVNGIPGSNIFPGGTVVLPGYSVMQSDNASIPTTFIFDQPIYLAPKTEYCFVLKSTSLGYDVWCSRFGDIDIVSGKVIDEQPTNGVLFKSSNDSTWTPNQYEDIKYDINIANFDITAPTLVKFKPQKYTIDDGNSTPVYYDSKFTLPISYISTTEGSNLVTITIPMHGLIANNIIYIGDFPHTTFNNIPYTDFENTSFNVEYVDEDNIRIIVDTPANKSGAILIQDDPQVINTSPPISIANTTYNTAIEFNNGNNTLALNPVIDSAPIAPIPPKSITTATFDVYTNIIFDEVMLDYLGTEFANTSVDEVLYVGRGNSIAETSNQQPGTIAAININNDKQFVELSHPAILLSGHNEAATSGFGNNGLLEISMQSTDNYISPVIEMSGLSLIVKSYKIDNQGEEITDIFANKTFSSPYTSLSDKYKDELNDSTLNSEIISGLGNANAKYKSRLIKLDPSYATKRIALYVTGICPEEAALDMYIRLSNDEFTHIDRNWIWVPIYNPKSTTLDYTMPFTASVSSLTMTEWCYEYLHDEAFTVADFKIVMRSVNNSAVPKIHGIRAITNIT